MLSQEVMSLPSCEMCKQGLDDLRKAICFQMELKAPTGCRDDCWESGGVEGDWGERSMKQSPRSSSPDISGLVSLVDLKINEI